MGNERRNAINIVMTAEFPDYNSSISNGEFLLNTKRLINSL